MNTVKYKQPDPNFMGTLLTDPSTGKVYLLGGSGEGQYICVSLHDGCSWNGLRPSAEEAMEGLVIIHTSAEITIKPIQ